jgi:hypothetical protein
MTMTQTTAQIAKLEYNAARELLTGAIGTTQFHFIAYSGGSRGHKAKVGAPQAAKYLHAQADSLYGHLATTRTIEKGGKFVQRGGTLPPGHYLCQYHAHHPTFGECIQLLQTKDALAIHSPFSPFPIPHGRGGFFIHGSGPKGSDGCIVPASNADRVNLNKAVKGFPGKVILLVTHASYMLPAELGGQLA